MCIRIDDKLAKKMIALISYPCGGYTNRPLDYCFKLSLLSSSCCSAFCYCSELHLSYAASFS